MNSNFIHYRLRRFCAFIIGLVFLLAGIFKLLDPVGAGLVVEEYYRFLGLTFMLPTAKAVAIFLALLEALLGAAMISGVWRDIVAIATSALIVFFTIITLFLAIFNPSMDCGCFGDAIHLTNGQTLLKNIVLRATCLGGHSVRPFQGSGRTEETEIHILLYRGRLNRRIHIIFTEFPAPCGLHLIQARKRAHLFL